MSAKPGEVVPIKTAQDRMISEAQRFAVEIAPVTGPYRIEWNAAESEKQVEGGEVGEKSLTEPDATLAALRQSVFWKQTKSYKPATAYGIRCDDLIVLDADGPKGMKTLASMKCKLPDTRRNRTQSGGEHVIFRNASGRKFKSDTKKKVFKGIDIKCRDRKSVV